MAINLQDFIFHSDYLPMPLLSNVSTTVSVSGTIPAFSSQVYYGSYVDTGVDSSFIDFIWTIPTPPAGWTIMAAQSQVNVPGSRVSDNQLGFQSSGWSSIAHGIYIQKTASSVRAAVVVNNNTPSTQTVPTVTIPVDISVYYAG